MKKSSKARMLSFLLIATQCVFPYGGMTAMAARKSTNTTTAVESDGTSIYEQRFMELYNDIYDKDNGYFNKQGIPYHSVETLMVEAPDHGHESTSEAASYLLWLQAMKGKITNDYSGIKDAWDVIEKYYIPTEQDQPGQNSYRPDKPATYAAEHGLPEDYPSKLEFSTASGQDPLANELKNTYNNPMMYGMHWLIDVDNFYGYGRRGDGVSTPSYINTYQRGEQESVWETVPHPSWEEYKWGGPNGFLPLFTQDNSYSKQWRYTIASDADARVVQAMYNAEKWAKEDNKTLTPYVQKASKMGDYLRYSLFDKYFMKVGSQGLNPATGRDSEHYLLSWYYSWGGGLNGDWSWRIGCSHNHFGYQNPMAAWVLSENSEFIPKSPTAKQDWEKSLTRQLEFYQWLQSSEGAIAGGATSSYNGSYDKYPAGTSTFYDMAYQENPVYADPGSNEWFGMQCWSMQRVAEYYYQSGDESVKPLLDKWAKWAVSQVKLNDDGTYEVPSQLKWSGQPDTWTGKYTGNRNLHVKVTKWSHDIGVTSSLANTLTYYAAGVQKHTSSTSYESYVKVAQELLNRMWTLYKDDKGIGDPQDCSTMLERFFDQKVAVPSNFSGKMANGDKIVPGATFYSLRTKYSQDPDFKRLKDAYDNNKPFSMTYHRFWAQSEAAIALGLMDEFFPGEKIVDENQAPTVEITAPVNAATYDVEKYEDGIDVKATADVKDAKIEKVEFYANDEKFAEDKTGSYEAVYVPTKTGFVNGKKTVTLKAVAYADNGKSTESSEVKVTFTTEEKVVESAVKITSPKAGTIDYTKTQTPIKVSVEGITKDSKVKYINVYAGSKKIGTLRTIKGTVSFTPDSTGMDENGVKKINLRAYLKDSTGKRVKSSVVTIKVLFEIPDEKPVDPEKPVNPSESENEMGLKVDYTAGNQGVVTNTIGGNFAITTDKAVTLSDVKIRYYFTMEDPSKQYAERDNVGMNLVSNPWYVNLTSSTDAEIVNVEDDLYYMELSFNSNQTLSRGDKVSIATRIRKENWTNYDQADDYSYNNGVVVLYKNSVISGKIPQ